MKPAIFLLALCAISTVFADEQFEKDLTNLRDESFIQMSGIMNELFSAIHFAIQDVQAQGIGDDVNECWKEYLAMAQYYQAAIIKCVQCYYKATQNRDIQIAEKCFHFNVIVLQTQANLRRFSTNRCITKHLFVLGPRGGRNFYQIKL